MPQDVTTEESVELSHDIHVVVEVDWEYEKNPFDKEIPHYHGEDDGWYIHGWRVTRTKLPEALEKELDDAVHRLNPPEEP